MNTYFVLYKKDRLGAPRSRPYHLVLEEMKRQEIEDAKLKQSIYVKHESIRNPPLKENGLNQLITPMNTKSTESVQTASPVNINNGKDVSLRFTRISPSKPKISNDQPIKTSELISDPSHSMISMQRRSRSRTCELL